MPIYDFRPLPISGAYTDQAGTPIPDALITGVAYMHNDCTHGMQIDRDTTTTISDGSYEVSLNLPVGDTACVELLADTFYHQNLWENKVVPVISQLACTPDGGCVEKSDTMHIDL